MDKPVSADQPGSDTGCHLDDLPRVMYDRDGCCERIKELSGISMT